MDNARVTAAAKRHQRQGRIAGGVMIAFVAMAVATAVIVGIGKGPGVVSADAGGCKSISSPWTPISDTASELSGDLKGQVATSDFQIVGGAFPVFEFTSKAVYEVNGGIFNADLAGTVNVDTLDTDFTSVPTSGTGRWQGVTGQVHITGNVLTGGDSEGFLCVGKSEWDNGSRQNF